MTAAGTKKTVTYTSEAYMRKHKMERNRISRSAKKIVWTDVSIPPPCDGLYFTKNNELRGEVELTSYELRKGIPYWSTSFKPDYWGVSSEE
jgi:hypothetical protein